MICMRGGLRGGGVVVGGGGIHLRFWVHDSGVGFCCWSHGVCAFNVMWCVVSCCAYRGGQRGEHGGDEPREDDGEDACVCMSL